jgi:DNA polymerase III delta' subunit
LTAAALERSSFAAVLGQEAACGVLLSALESGRVPHAYLFAGPAGVGKRAAATAWAQVLNCAAPEAPARACGECGSCRKIAAGGHPDVLWVNFDFQARLLNEPPEKQLTLKIKTVREMIHLLHLRPSEGKFKLALIDPADQLGPDAAHALLKVLEEPPPQTHLVLFVTDPSQLLGTIRSRCQWVRFRPLPAEALRGHLEKRPGVSAEAAAAAALRAEGSLARALELLDGGEELSFDWEAAPLSELLSWCEQFGGARVGRDAAEDYLRRLLADLQAKVRCGEERTAEARRALDALHRLKQNVSPQLVLETLLLRLRWDRKARS